MPGKAFIHPDFMLTNKTAARLYHEYAANLPIIDYHCHLSPRMIAEDHRFADACELWLGGDHYKWRAMRACGIPEEFITGGAEPYQKFLRWAQTVARLPRNPLYHWTHLELANYFGITDRLLGPETAEGIWEEMNDALNTREFSCRRLIQRSNVQVICTTDDPTDDLSDHEIIAASEDFNVQVLPTWRPDRVLGMESPSKWNAWLEQLENVTGVQISNYDSLVDALHQRQEFFHAHGCRLSDHGLEYLPDADACKTDLNTIFAIARGGQVPTATQCDVFRSGVLQAMASWEYEHEWTQQFHLGVARNLSTRMMDQYGPDAGCDAMSDMPIAQGLARFLDRLQREQCLGRTIVYNLNPRDNYIISTVLGSFQDGTIPGKLQLGSGWWFLDQADGIRRQIEVLSQTGVLSLFVGMLTDSRSFISYTRHEYFRRLLCDIIGNDIERGLLPEDLDISARLVQDICYFNAKSYFAF